MTVIHGKSVHKGTLKHQISLKYNVLIQIKNGKILLHVSAFQPKIAATKSKKLCQKGIPKDDKSTTNLSTKISRNSITFCDKIYSDISWLFSALPVQYFIVIIN